MEKSVNEKFFMLILPFNCINKYIMTKKKKKEKSICKNFMELLLHIKIDSSNFGDFVFAKMMQIYDSKSK